MTKYTKEFKEIIVKEYQQGISCKNICAKYSIPKSCLYDWLKFFQVKTNPKNGESFTYQEYCKLKKHLTKISRELEIIKQSHCFPDSNIKEKEAAIENLLGKFHVKEMCRVLKLPTGTFYNYHFRRVEITQNQIRDEMLKKEIMKIYTESEGRFGASKIQAKLETRGIKTTQTKVSSLMFQMNIKSKQSKKRSFNKQENKLSFCKNILNQNFNQAEPNKYWVSDITEVRVSENKFYLCVIIDLFSRKVIAYRLSSQNNASLTINTFKDAYESQNHPIGLSFHNDQGTPYTCHEFRDLLFSLKVAHSFSNKGNPYDNAVIESFFSNYKKEDYNYKNFQFFDELKESVDKFVQYYNDYRPHMSLQNKTPNQFEDDYWSGVSSVLSG